ncbi:perilipin-3-like isoform X2 [Mauremys reevesii]|uniref:perilipin-3-like isoform X2 n=1 Tax=Mauremys reevesii TaxID=260615 RepID=UPI00193FB3DC|nr:perilipin-3-like isoform X2 [Mauremys reevesii]
MASNGKDTTMASPEHGEEEQQNVLRRVASLPLVNSAYDLAATAYASTKESHPYVRSICDMAEKGVTSITNAAVSSAQPVVTKLEPEAELAESVEGAEVASAQPQEHRSYFVRLGSLSTKLRQRAYHYSLNKMRHTSQSIREALSQLHQTMGLIEYLKQGVSLQEVQEKFHHIWLSWNKEQPKSSEMKDLAKPEDLSSSLLTQSQEMVTKAQEHVDELMAYVMENTPLSWVVGPFIPSGKLSADSLEPQNQENEAEEASKSKEDL